MATSFPTALAVFDGLPVEDCKFQLPDNVAYSRTRGGDYLKSEYGDRLWTGKALLAYSEFFTARGHQAKIHLLQEAAASFMATDPSYNGPAYDPDGTILGASVPQIKTLVFGQRELVLKGLPVGYTLTPGDYLSFQYGSSPVRYAFHQVVVGSVADGVGDTGNIEVIPYINLGAVVNTDVVLVKPYFKAIMVPASFAIGQSTDLGITGMGFDFIQTLR